MGLHRTIAGTEASPGSFMITSEQTVRAAVKAAPLAPPAVRPWTWPWFKWAKGEGKTFFWVCLLHGLSLIGVALFPLPGWPVALAAYGLFWLGGLGTTIAYHRALAHRAVKLNPVVEFLLVAAAIFNGSGTPATWTANHRLHHATSDTPADISSPRVGGFWWAHLRWLWQIPQTSIARWAPDLNRPKYAAWTRLQLPILAVALCIGAPFGWAAFFWLGPIRLLFALHSQCVANSIAHMEPVMRDGEDSSRNVAWLSPVQAFQGENWHRNHHAQPASARLGWTWAQIDLGWWFIVGLEKLHLATKVRRPRGAHANFSPADVPVPVSGNHPT